MSATTEQRAWQRSRPSATARNTQSRSANSSPNPSNTPAKAAAPAPTNVWAKRQEERSQSAHSKVAAATTPKESTSTSIKDTSRKTGEGAGAPPLSNQSQHIPLNGFNSSEVRDFLKSGPKVASYKIKSSGEETKAVSSVKTQRQTSDGQDFFAQLNKQIAALRANKQ